MSMSEANNLDAPDLGALLARVIPRIIAIEQPILDAVGLTMWEYAIVTELASRAAVSQRDLSRRVRRDPTRLGRHIDDLVSRGLLTRERAEDHRHWMVSLSPEGRTLYGRVKRAVRDAEGEYLQAFLTQTEGAQLRHLLGRLVEG